jgi:purine catabolism regulator
MWRSFDVGSVIQSLTAGDGRLVAGHGGLDRRVQRARLAAHADDLRRAGPYELVVTTTSVLADAGESPAHVIARFDAALVAAVAVRLDTSAELPGALLADADRAAIPVIAFPQGAALSDVSAAVLDALLGAQSVRLDRVLDIHQRFTRIGAAGGGVTEVATTLHALLDTPVVVLDADRRTSIVVPSDAGGEELASAIDGGVEQPIAAGAQVYGSVVALTGGRPLDDDGELALERAAMAIAVRFAQAAAVAEAQERFAAVSLEALIAGNLGDAAEVAERASSFGWDLGRPRAVLLASIDPPADVRNEAALTTIAAAARATLGADSIVWTRSATIAALIPPATDEPGERRQIAERLRRELDTRLRSATVSIGVGRRVHDPADLASSFVEARRAVDVGRWAKGRHVTQIYDELGLERLLASASSSDLAEFVEHAIGPLVAHDREHRSELVTTLQAWLDTRNMAAAARLIHVHYNTFKNRLERIETILGPVLSDPRRSLECAVALYVAHHYDGPWTTVGRDGVPMGAERYGEGGGDG